ncbi:MAG: FeoB-associated Cys-rich membrane protein [Lentisphaerae bacterium]|nr:FeoB-associated Cys-rich membrane protein [Lentisphaerota bacterium]MCP4100800.1 FeoB-associated Cys-rich membrane protein [Lentisphaerota bacterium]
MEYVIVGIIVLAALLVVIRSLCKVGKEGGGCSCCNSSCTPDDRNKCHSAKKDEDSSES